MSSFDLTLSSEQWCVDGMTYFTGGVLGKNFEESGEQADFTDVDVQKTIERMTKCE